MDDDALQDYDASFPDPVRVWVFCRDCRCRLQVRMIPRPELPFTCLCGKRGHLREFDVTEREEKAQEVAEAFELAYVATKEALAGMIDFKKTRMYESGDFASLLSSDVAAPQEGRHAPGPFETEDDYQAQLGALMRTLDAMGNDPIGRHEALVEVAEFTFARRHLRHAARSMCVRACRADVEGLNTLVNFVRATAPSTRLRFPTFRCMVTVYEEAGDLAQALRTALRAQAAGMPGFADKIAELRAARGGGR